MKVAILFAVLAVCAVGQAGVVPGPSKSRASMYFGNIQPGDRILTRVDLARRPLPNAIQSQDFVFSRSNSRISAIRAMEVGPSQNGVAWIFQGGIGMNHVSIRLQSGAPGWGYHYMIEVWGR